MKEILNNLVNNYYGLIIVLACLLFALIYIVYMKIKYSILNKACAYIAEVEKMTELSGEEKFNVVKGYIKNEITFAQIQLVKFIPNNSTNKIIQYAFDNSKLFYLARKNNEDCETK